MKISRSHIILFLFITTFSAYTQELYHKKLYLMGSSFEITVVAQDDLRALKAINMAVDEIKRVEKMISSWDPKSETSKINRNAGIKPVKISPELFQLIKRAKVISKITDGAFDISYASMDKIWKFDGSMMHMPSKEEIKNSVKKVGYKNILLNEQNTSVFLKKKGMKIGFGGIGKGYAADMAKKLLISKGVKAGIINASGDMNIWGKQPGNKDWTVAITNPLNKKQAFGLVPVTNRAVVTSGNYEKYVIFKGIRYTHIINPKTGYPATGIISATIFAPSAELADALATSVFVLGIEDGLNLINQIPNIDGIFIDEKGHIYKSKKIHVNEK